MIKENHIRKVRKSEERKVKNIGKPHFYLVEAGFSSGFSQKTPLHSLASVLLLCVLIFYSKGQVQVNMSLIYIELNFYNSIQKQ